MKFLKSLFLFCYVSLVVGCSTIQTAYNEKMDQLNSGNFSKKNFQIHKNWVRNSLLEDNLGPRKLNRSQPIILGDAVITANGVNGVTAFSAANGSLIWKVNIPNGVEAGFALVKQRLYFGGSDGKLYCIDIRTGQVLWSFQTQSEVVAAPEISQEGQVFFLSGNNVLFALDAESGKQLWSYTRQDTSSISVRGGAKPTLWNGHLLIGFSDGSLVSFNSKTGSPEWEVQLNKGKRFRDIDSQTIVDNDKIYVSGYDDKLYCLNPNKGEVLWRFDEGGYGEVFIEGDFIFFSTTKGQVYSLKKETGQVQWSYKLKEGIATSPRVFKGITVFGESQGSLIFLDQRTGKKLGSFEPGRGILSTPSIDQKNNRVYFISGEGNLYSLRAGWETSQLFEYLK